MSPSFYQALPDPAPLVGAKTPYALALFYHTKLQIFQNVLFIL